MARQFETLAAAMVSAPDAPIATLPLMDEATRRVCSLPHERRVVISRATTIHRRFAEQARARPQAIAVDALDYAALDAAAGRLARESAPRESALRQCRRRRAAQFRRHRDAWLAVLKAGAAYLPIDPAIPAERAAFILDDARVALAVADDALVSLFARRSVSVVQPERDAQRIGGARRKRR
jgi:nonribosomal peptide synthetase protein BlmIX